MSTGPVRSDEQLVREAAAGSGPAFSALYDRHVAGVARALASFAGPDADLLDDLVQDVFLRVVGHLAAWEPTHPFTHWLYTIALNVGRNHVRKHGQATRLDVEVLNDLAAPAQGDPVTAVALMRLVAQLPEAMRQVVSLRIGPELPFGEIAELLGIPEGTARSRMHHAIRLLREKFEDSSRECNGHD